MTGPVLNVVDLGKAFVEYRHEVRRIARWFGARVQPDSEHWVVRHLTFRVAPGEALGLIGQNGAGKSTVLRMIAGTTRPSEGAVFIGGSVSALLELGLGFNPELTGRENVEHSAGLMGISPERVLSLVPDIEAFAEVGEYFDQPLRMYSSGMQMRVAFSVATAQRPDILIVDEALAVGDAYFVHKCFQRIREFRDAGTTILLVSHDASAIQSLCDRAILIDGGRMVLDGEPRQVFDYYNALIADKENHTVRSEVTAAGEAATVSGTGEARFLQIQMRDEAGRAVEYVGVGQRLVLHATVEIVEPVERLVFGYMIRDRLGQVLFGTNTQHTDQAIEQLEGGETIEFQVRFAANLGAGSYSVSVALSSSDTHLIDNYQWKDLALIFTVANMGQPHFVGMAWMPPDIQIMRGGQQATSGSLEDRQ